MVNKISLVKSHIVAYVLDAQSLRGFFNLLQKANPTVEVKIEVPNYKAYHFTDLEEVIDFPNSSRNEIKKLTLETSYSANLYIKLTLENPFLAPSILYAISGENAQVVYYQNEIESRIKGMSASWWYTLIAYSPSFVIIAFIGAILSTVSLVSTYLQIPADMRDPQFLLPALSRLTTEIWGNLLFTAISYIVLGGLVDRFIKNRLFPIVTFAIGAGQKRYEQSLFWRNTVIVGLIVGSG